MLSLDDAQNLNGSTLTDTDGSKIGEVSDVYIDNDTQRPEWALVHTGLFGRKVSFVPLAQAQLTGGNVRVPYSKDQVKDAPNADPDGELSQEEESRLYSHYGLHYSDASSDSGLPTGTTGTGSAGTGSSGTTSSGTTAVGTSSTTSTGTTPTGTSSTGTSATSTGTTAVRAGDDEEVLHEEQLKVGTVRRPSQMVRLQKHVVTENVSTTVPVHKERAHITREPVTDANRAQADPNPQIGESTYELELDEEQPVVTKETVPVELVHLGKETVTEERTVNETVHREVADVEGGTDAERR